MFCGSCGRENPDESNFCTQCGKALKEGVSEVPQQYQEPGAPQPYQQMPPQQYQRPDMKENFKQSAVSGAGTYAGCCCMNALTNLMCDACE